MITPEEVKSMGIDAPVEHQKVIAKLMTRLGTMYYDLKTISLEPLPETMLDETKNSPVPDLMLCDHTNDTVPVIIEITRTRTVNADIKNFATSSQKATTASLKDLSMTTRKTNGTSIKKESAQSLNAPHSATRLI